MTETPPSWYTAGVPWAPVKQPGGSDVGLNLPQLDQQQLDALRQQLIENILRAVLLAVQQIALPGPIGSAFTQLTQWAGGVNTSSANWTTLFNSLPGVANVGQFVNFLNSIGATGLASLIDGLTTFFTGTPSSGVDISTLTNLLNDPVGTVRQWVSPVLNPAGLLTSTTQFPAYLLNAFAPGTSTTNLIPDPNFTDPSQFLGLGNWLSWSNVAPPGSPAGAGSALMTANGTLLELEGVPMPVGAASGNINVGASVLWQNLVATGQAIEVAVNSYSGLNADGSVIEPALADPNRVIASVTSPAANSSGWQTISGQYMPPAGTKYATLVPTVRETATAGTVQFGAPLFQTTSRIDAALIGNVDNITPLLGTSILGFQDLPTIIDSFSHIVDGLGSSFSTDAQSGLQFSDLFSLAQSMAQNAISASGLANSHQQTLTNQTNFPLGAGLDPTAESTFRLLDLPHGATLPTTTVAPGNAIGGPVNILKDSTKGFVEFIASIPAGSSGVYANAYKINTSTGVRTLLWGSSDIASTIPTAAGWVKALIPGSSQPAVQASDQVHLEIVNQSPNTLTVVAKQQPQPNRASGILRNFGMARITSGTVSPSTVADSAFTYSGVTPFVSFGVSQVPPNYQPPILAKLSTPTGYSGTNTAASYTLPSWFRAGVDFVDWVIAPAGGGGDSGSGGPGGAGGDTTVTIDGVVHTAPGTPGANSGGVLDAGASAARGKGLGSFTYNGQLYQAGGDVGAQAAGSIPGGGGGGGAQFVGYTTYYGAGAAKGTWLAGTAQPTGTTISVSLGHGGPGQTSYSAGPGAAATVWLRIYQNPAA